MSNRLAGETSPYLLQHKDNPVDWYPWGDEAFARARDEDRPVLLSVGYSACHWCHVMEHESFSDQDTAELMNELFINIKVDREERPDVDSLYMQAVQQMTGHGGWPMTVFLTPDGSPFYGGTYFPPEPRHGLPSFKQLLQAIHDAYRQRPEEVEKASTDLRELLIRGMLINPEPGRLDEGVLHRAFHGLVSRFDHRYGGFGGAPKFPQPMQLEFLMRYHLRTGAQDAIETAERTLEAMARGGIFDQLGGGFHRYSVDARWLVPHFEKMLYDNALLSLAYLHGYQLTDREEFRNVVVATLDYVARELRSPVGAFYSSQDADSEGEEGRFYVWTDREVDETLGTEEGRIFRSCFDIQPGGNWEGKSILNIRQDFGEVAAEIGVTRDELEDVVQRGRAALYDRRSRRVWPGTDEKILTSWNAMMLQAFAEAGRALEVPHYIEIAVASADFLLTELYRDGRLLRTWRDGKAQIPAFLEDYGTLVGGCIALYEATYDSRWVRQAKALADSMIELFWSPEEEMFFDTASSNDELIIRPRDMYDNATPSGTSAATAALLRLARLTADSTYERIAARVLAGLGDTASRVPQAFGNLLSALVLHFTPPTEVAILGRQGAQDTDSLLRTVHSRYLPMTTVAFKGTSPEEEGIDSLIPLLSGRGLIDNRATAYVCRHYACQQPVTDAADLDRDIREYIINPAAGDLRG